MNFQDLPRLERPVHRRRIDAEKARRLLDAGMHPLGFPLAGNGGSCGDCSNLRKKRMGNTYFKCALRDTSSQATDIRKWSPACTKFKASA